VFCGLVYFYLYKAIKQKLYSVFGAQSNLYGVVFASTVLSELFCLTVYFPFDLIKCRLQSKNCEFGYKNIPDAFFKEINQHGIRGLYQGVE
jgi:hypothetical protein